MPSPLVVRAISGIGCIAGVVLALLGLGGVAGSLVIPAGPAGSMSLALDPVSALFLLAVMLPGAAAALEAEGPAAALVPVATGAMALALLAADGFTLALAFGLMSVVSWGLDRTAGPGLTQTAVATLCLAAALALLSPPGALMDLRFAAMRAAPPEGARGAAVLALATLGAGLRMFWPPRLAQPGAAGALLGSGMAAVAAYVLVRVLFDLCGAATPLWWGLPLMGVGAAMSVWGGLRANVEDDMLAILAAHRIGAVGVAMAGLGIALAARGTDAPAVAALALAGAGLHGAGAVVIDMLLALCGAAVQRGAGTRALSRLGGMVRTMPWVALGTLAGAAAMAGLPLTAGFGGRWLLVQSVLGARGFDGLWLQVCLASVLAAMALGTGLAAAAAVRLVGIGLLGRPRTPRAAAAEDAPRRVRLVIAAVAGLCMALGLWPAAALALARPALAWLLGTEAPGAGWLAVSAQDGAPGYAALHVAAVAALAGAGAVALARRFAARGARAAPAWSGGFEAPPPWLPFGDPATQYSAGSASRELVRSLGQAPKHLPALRRAVLNRITLRWATRPWITRPWITRPWITRPWATPGWIEALLNGTRRPGWRGAAWALLLAVAALLLWAT